LIGELAEIRSCFLGVASLVLTERRNSARPALFDADGALLSAWLLWAIAGFGFDTGNGWVKEASMFAD